MTTPYESATLNLKLFELRRDPQLREARAWFTAEFHPKSFTELATIASERNTWFRMVLGYWDMAASLVTSGAIDGDAFRAAHTEVFVTFAKVAPYLDELRVKTREPNFCRHLEAVVTQAPNYEAILENRRAAAVKFRRREETERTE
ncbi:MAG: hypothetical protein ABIT20_13430 [Gemmatimonadaceae bacterium]